MTGRLQLIRTAKTLQFVAVLISMVSLIIFLYYSSVGYYYLLHYYYSPAATFFNFYFTHQTLDRNFMFLICNGILAFLAKTVQEKASPVVVPFSNDSVEVKVVDSPLGSSSDDDQVKPFTVPPLVPVQFWLPDAPSWPEPIEKTATDNHPHVGENVDEEEDEEVKKTGNSLSYLETDDIGDETQVADDEEKGEEDKLTANEEDHDDEGEVAATSEEYMSTDELNRKIEEFIRKMKEEIRIDQDQSQLVIAV